MCFLSPTTLLSLSLSLPLEVVAGPSHSIYLVFILFLMNFEVNFTLLTLIIITEKSREARATSHLLNRYEKKKFEIKAQVLFNTFFLVVLSYTTNDSIQVIFFPDWGVQCSLHLCRSQNTDKP